MRIGKYRLYLTEEAKENMEVAIGGIATFVCMFVIMLIVCFVL